jgi:dipeptidyl aminopeptidase/acylaminoacyl peptidase
MKINIVAIVVLYLFISIPINAETEKIPLNHDVYDGWKNIFRHQISPDGEWISWEANPQTGDGWLHIKERLTGRADSVSRGTRASFSPGSEYIAFLVKPERSTIRQVKVANKRGSEMPRDTLTIRIFSTGERIFIERVRSFSTARQESPWLVYHLHSDPETTNQNSGGTTLVIFNPLTKEKHEFPNVTEYRLSDDGRLVAFIEAQRVRIQVQNESISDTTDKKKPLADLATVRVFDTRTQSAIRIRNAVGKAKTISVHESGQAAFLFSPANIETDGSNKNDNPEIYSLWHWKEGLQRAVRIVDAKSKGMPEGWSVSEHSSISFTENGDRIFFGTSERPQPEPEDTLLREERYHVDIWHYMDERIQPQQLTELRRDQRMTYTAVYHIEDERMVQLACRVMPHVTTVQKGNGSLEIGTSSVPYQILNSFEGSGFSDVYLVDVNTGRRRLVLEKYRGSALLSTPGNAGLSPDGKYLLYYSQGDRNWHALSTTDYSTRNLTKNIPVPMYNELHDQPNDPGFYGIAGWTENDRHVLVYDRYDIWKIDPSGRYNANLLTRGYGRANNIQFRYAELEFDEERIGRRERILLSAFNEQTKQDGFYTVRVHRRSNPEKIIMDDARYFTPLKAKEADILLWRKSTFQEFPDLWVSNPDFGEAQKISTANPQQAGYKWGSAQLVDWVSFRKDTLQGILYTPEDMDPDRKYPMLVYFYERSSNNLHRHYVPAPSRSVINISYYVSNDYVVFVPDIPYVTGSPGHSAYNSVVSGTQAMLSRFDFIDPGNIGLQGQSWGGYQITWLVTQTNMYKAAMAGAPVSNMTSAYGGIRWASGVSRIAQYEQTQSRIGVSLWDEPLLYLENSPLFFADKVSTPLLMMHNDDDGAVPWSQGIEFFMALRRLGKPVWMLNYNGESHNLTRRPNMMDLSVRMYQFFDHYLKDKPAPLWLRSGIPATEKGRMHGYELVN